MKAYLDLLNHVMTFGKDREDRTGTGTRAVFGYQFRHDLRAGFPLLTTKKVHIKSVIYELLWFLRGDTNVKYLQDHGITIWNEWADKDGELGPVYGKQWRNWEFYTKAGGVQFIDQIRNLLHDLEHNPYSRRHIVSAWNPSDVPSMKLPPCHTLWQCQVEPAPADGKQTLNLHLYARSIDSFLGLPFNIASYAFLLSMIAHVKGMTAGELIISFGDLHIYRNHFDQVKEQLSRDPRPLPRLEIHNDCGSMAHFEYSDFEILAYDPYPAIKAPIAV